MSAAPAQEAELEDQPVDWCSPFTWVSDLERSPNWWSGPKLLAVMGPAKILYYRPDELDDVKYL